MAAAEARAVWQRTANRCFMQEDAKRAPKLACCQSSSSSGFKQVDGAPANPEDGVDPPVSGFMPFNRKPSFCNNLPSDTRWWLQLQPSYGLVKGFPCEQLNSSETQMEILKSGEATSVEKDEDADSSNTESNREPVSDAMSGGVKGMKSVDVMSSYEFVEFGSFGSSVSKRHSDLEFEVDSLWSGSGKSEPWWRTTDKDDIASLVAKKSLDHVENCDLPPPQKVRVTMHPYSHLGCLDSQNILNSTSQKMGSTDTGQDFGMKWCSADEGCFTYGSYKSSSKTSYSTSEEDKKAASSESLEPDPTKAQLLEALCHSQTRAREAEKAAKRANAEKEHIIKLFFKQASQLFAYKQWFQLLQLESIYFQIKDREEEPSASPFFPEVRPRMAWKAKKLGRRAARGKRVNRGKLRVDVAKYAVAITLGLSLVGAGLLLGWTVGWMLPPF